MKKVGALTRALEVETRKVKKELAGREKEECTPAAAKVDDTKNRDTHYSRRFD